jgi:glycosyltransferase involved in cell wall biosynthesis
MMRLSRPTGLTGRPRVSVVIPCYNYGNFLPQAVRSATVDQPGVDVDVLVVDDASPDGSGDVARALADADPRVRVLQHEQNKGHLETYNDGLRAVEGDYVALLSADDLLGRGALARSAALLDARPSVGFVYGIAQKFFDEPKTGPRRVRSWGIWQGREWYVGRARSGRNPILSPEVVMRRKLLDELGYYDLKLPHTADMYLWMRAAQVSDVGRVNGPFQAHYRMHPNQMHWTDFHGVANDLRERLRTWQRVFDEDPGDSTGLDEAARKALAFEAAGYAAVAYDQGRNDGVPAGELSGLAREIWPDITATRAWRYLEVRRKAAGRVPWARGAAALRTSRKGIRWLRSRRYGI